LGVGLTTLPCKKENCWEAYAGLWSQGKKKKALK